MRDCLTAVKPRRPPKTRDSCYVDLTFRYGEMFVDAGPKREFPQCRTKITCDQKHMLFRIRHRIV